MKALLQQALDALECAYSDDMPYLEKTLASIEALRAAIAQPESEPVRWEYRWTNPGDRTDQPESMFDWKAVYPMEDRVIDLEADRYKGKPCYEVRALYAAPQVADYVPLTDGDIQRIVVAACNEQYGVEGNIKYTDADAKFYGIAFRAIERAVRGAS